MVLSLLVTQRPPSLHSAHNHPEDALLYSHSLSTSFFLLEKNFHADTGSLGNTQADGTKSLEMVSVVLKL